MDLRNVSVKRCGLFNLTENLGPVVGSCEYGNEISGSIKGGEFLE
jgi:hypothetical protein